MINGIGYDFYFICVGLFFFVFLGFFFQFLKKNLAAPHSLQDLKFRDQVLNAGHGSESPES